MLTISAISKSFSGRVLFQDASLQVNRGERIPIEEIERELPSWVIR